MIARRALPEDVTNAQAWMVARGVPEIPADTFSSVGFVVSGIAGVWLYRTDSSIAFLEMLVSNPDAPKDERRAALDAVVARAIEEASATGVRLLTCHVTRHDVHELAQRHGLTALGATTYFAMNPKGSL